MDQIYPERAPAEQVDHFSCAFARSDMSVSKPEHKQEKADCRDSYKWADIRQRILIMVAGHRRNSPCDPERCSHAEHADYSQRSLADPDMTSVFVEIISHKHVPCIDPVASPPMSHST